MCRSSKPCPLSPEYQLMSGNDGPTYRISQDPRHESHRSVITYDELDHTATEVRILKHFAKYEPNNPFIVRLNYAFTDKENIYFVMDFYPGKLQSSFS
jgi:hypothetical protein